MASPTSFCTHCSATKSPLWRRGVHNEVLCNACGLYWKHHGVYRPLSLKFPSLSSTSGGKKKSSKRPSRTSTPVSPSDSSKNINGSGGFDANRLKTTLSSTLSRRKITPIRCADLEIGFGVGLEHNTSQNNRNNLAILQTKSGQWRSEPLSVSHQVSMPYIESLVAAPICNDPDGPRHEANMQQSKGTKYIMLKTKMMFIGDHIALLGDDHQIYFGLVNDFWIQSDGRKFCKIRWLIPHPNHYTQILGPKEAIDPAFFTLGPLHDEPISFDDVVDIFFSSEMHKAPLSNLFTFQDYYGDDEKAKSDDDLDANEKTNNEFKSVNLCDENPIDHYNYLDTTHQVEMAHLLCSIRQQ